MLAALFLHASRRVVKVYWFQLEGCSAVVLGRGCSPVETMSYANRVKTAIALLVCFGLASSFLILRSARRELDGEAFRGDRVTLFEARLEGIRRDLPTYGVVGYITDPPNDINEELVWTRYYLVPLVVLPSVKHHLVIGNFHKPPPTEFLSGWHLVLMKDYGNGIMLFMNRQR